MIPQEDVEDVKEQRREERREKTSSVADGISTGLRVWLFFLLGFYLVGYSVPLAILFGAMGGFAAGWIIAWWHSPNLPHRKDLPSETGQRYSKTKIGEAQRKRAARERKSPGESWGNLWSRMRR